jgi:hypothetical protein
MPERGIDISEWQEGMDVERVVRENGLSFVMVRTNYGSNHDDAQFHKHCDGAERGGAIVTPYVYPLASDTYGSIDDCVRIIGGRYDRCIVDWEEGSGGGDQLRAAHERVWEHGLSTPLVYDPTWYWERQGRPNMDWMGQSGGIGGRWKSWYPDYDPGSFDAILRKLAGSVWSDSRGGIATRIVQFTSSGRLSGWGKNLDLNYFPGSLDELHDLLGGDDMGQLTGRQAEMFQQIYDALAKPFVQNGRDVGEVFATLGRLFPDLDPAAMEKFETQNPGTLTNALASSYSLLYKYIYPALGTFGVQLEALAKAYADGRQQDATELLAAMRQALGDLLSAHVQADVTVTLNPLASDNEQVLTGQLATKSAGTGSGVQE